MLLGTVYFTFSYRIVLKYFILSSEILYIYHTVTKIYYGIKRVAVYMARACLGNEYGREIYHVLIYVCVFE